MYQVGQDPQQDRKRRRRRRLIWLIILLLLIVALVVAFIIIKDKLKVKPVIKQAAAISSTISYNTQTKKYVEPDFTITLPTTWLPIPRPVGPYQSYNWRETDSGTSQDLTIYEDTIPLNLAVNRVLIVQGQDDHLLVEGTASDDCSTFTKDVSADPIAQGAPAKWQGIDFWCDQNNTERDVIGTSSTDGPNIVLLKSQLTGVNHKFLFTLDDDSAEPNYTDFYNALTSLRMN